MRKIDIKTNDEDKSDAIDSLEIMNDEVSEAILEKNEPVMVNQDSSESMPKTKIVTNSEGKSDTVDSSDTRNMDEENEVVLEKNETVNQDSSESIRKIHI